MLNYIFRVNNIIRVYRDHTINCDLAGNPSLCMFMLMYGHLLGQSYPCQEHDIYNQIILLMDFSGPSGQEKMSIMR